MVVPGDEVVLTFVPVFQKDMGGFEEKPVAWAKIDVKSRTSIVRFMERSKKSVEQSCDAISHGDPWSGLDLKIKSIKQIGPQTVIKATFAATPIKRLVDIFRADNRNKGVKPATKAGVPAVPFSTVRDYVVEAMGSWSQGSIVKGWRVDLLHGKVDVRLADA